MFSMTNLFCILVIQIPGCEYGHSACPVAFMWLGALLRELCATHPKPTGLTIQVGRWCALFHWRVYKRLSVYSGHFLLPSSIIHSYHSLVAAPQWLQFRNQNCSTGCHQHFRDTIVFTAHLVIFDLDHILKTNLEDGSQVNLSQSPLKRLVREE